MFDTVRKWAYKAIRAHRGSTFDVWLGEVLKQCKNVNNAFLEPLLYSEVKATAKKHCSILLEKRRLSLSGIYRSSE